MLPELEAAARSTAAGRWVESLRTPVFVHRSNRTERLIDALLEVVSRPLADGTVLGPMQSQCIVVSSRGMERWLSLQLAERLGVWAHPDFPFPRAFIERVLAAACGPVSGFDYSPAGLTWAVADLLLAAEEDPDWSPLRRYLEDDPPGTRTVGLSAKIAEAFDHYLVYRPEMLLAWQSGMDGDCPPDLHWQPRLWRRLVERHGHGHFAGRAHRALEVFAAAPSGTLALPRRVALFGVATLPKLYLQLLAALPEVEVHLFIPSPCREYWADVKPGMDGDDARSGGNSLLRSLGRLGREAQEILEDVVYREGSSDLYEAPEPHTLLTTLQADIVALRERLSERDRQVLSVTDESISIHECHGEMREVEVLRDRLIALFEADPTLDPHDVVVMAPDIESYAPYVQAVFGAGEDQRSPIPYSLADRHPRATHVVVDALLQALTVARGRLYAPEVFDLLGLDVVRERFEIIPEELEQIREWISESGIRWAADAAHRGHFDQPQREENTWTFGLQRLFLGYATGGGGPWCGRTPVSGIEGSRAVVVAKLAEFFDALSRLRDDLATSRSVSEWCEVLERALTAIIAWSDDLEPQHRFVRETIAELRREASTAGFEAEISAEAFEVQLEQRLARTPLMGGFGAGSVTFCAMVPMRAIPFRVVCLLGMNDETFPRRQRRPGFDLVALRRQKGDRSPRDDDRYLFLEALMSARQHLVISYVGRDAQNDSVIPPSIVVEELLDGLERSVDLGSSTVRHHVVVRHSIQGFSRRYFDGQDPRLFSYDQVAFQASLAATHQRRIESPFFPEALGRGDPMEPRTIIDLEELERFWRAPAKALLQRRLEVFLGDDVDRLRDREPLTVDGLQFWGVADRALTRRLAGEAWPAIREELEGSGFLPGGALGATVFAKVRRLVTALQDAAAPFLKGEALRWIDVEVDLGGTRIVGRLHGVSSHGLVDIRASRVRRRQEITVWLRHLVAATIDDRKEPSSTALIGRGREDEDVSVVVFSRPEAPRDLLAEFVRWFVHGQHFPLPFFPDASSAYAHDLLKHREADRALATIRERFAQPTQGRAPDESEDPYVLQAFRGLDPFDPNLPVPNGATFTSLAETLCVPWLRAKKGA